MSGKEGNPSPSAVRVVVGSRTPRKNPSPRKCVQNSETVSDEAGAESDDNEAFPQALEKGTKKSGSSDPSEICADHRKASKEALRSSTPKTRKSKRNLKTSTPVEEKSSRVKKRGTSKSDDVHARKGKGRKEPTEKKQASSHSQSSRRAKPKRVGRVSEEGSSDTVGGTKGKKTQRSLKVDEGTKEAVKTMSGNDCDDASNDTLRDKNVGKSECTRGECETTLSGETLFSEGEDVTAVSDVLNPDIVGAGTDERADKDLVPEGNQSDEMDCKINAENEDIRDDQSALASEEEADRNAKNDMSSCRSKVRSDNAKSSTKDEGKRKRSDGNSSLEKSVKKAKEGSPVSSDDGKPPSQSGPRGDSSTDQTPPGFALSCDELAAQLNSLNEMSAGLSTKLHKRITPR